MKKRWVIPALILLAVVAIGGLSGYFVVAGVFGNPVLVAVNGEKLSAARFQQEMDRLDPADQALLKGDPEKLLEGIVNKTLLLQQARKEGVSAPKESGSAKSGEDEEIATLRAYLDKKMTGLPPIDPVEVDGIYEAYRGQLGGRTREEAAPLIRRMLEQRRQGETLQKLIGDLRVSAKIEINQKELKKLAVVEPGMETQTEEDFRKAMVGGKASVVDFGSNSCIPCRELRPVLQTIRRSYADKLEVLIIDIRNHQRLASDHKIQVIPTVIFFSSEGKEVFRHQGFMSEQKIREQLARMGIV